MIFFPMEPRSNNKTILQLSLIHIWNKQKLVHKFHHLSPTNLDLSKKPWEAYKQILQQKTFEVNISTFKKALNNG